MKTADGTRSGTGQVIGDVGADYRNSSGYVLSGPEYFTVFTGQTGAIGATDELRPGPRHGVQLGRQLRQPGRPVPGRHRLPGRSAAVDHHGPRLLHACRRRGVGLPQRPADPAVDVRLEQLTSGNSTYAGQGNHSLSVADVDEDGKQEILYGAAAIDDNGDGPVEQPHRPRRRRARRRPDPEPSRPRVLQGHGERDAAGLLDGRRPHGPDPVEHPGHRATTAAASPTTSGRAARAPSRGRRPTRSCATPPARPSAASPGSTNFLAYWDGDTVARAARRDAHRQVRHGRRHPPADRRRTCGRTTAPSPPRRCRATSWATGARRSSGRSPTSRRCGSTRRRPPTSTRVWTLLHDQTYRVAIAWQNTAYNQPPHTGFFLGTPFTLPAQPKISTP